IAAARFIALVNLATVYALTGEPDLAFQHLAVSAKTPGGVNYGWLKLDPRWDPLRADPRFESLVAQLAPRVRKPMRPFDRRVAGADPSSVTCDPPARSRPEKISVARLPVTGSDVFGREEDIAFLNDAW